MDKNPILLTLRPSKSLYLFLLICLLAGGGCAFGSRAHIAQAIADNGQLQPVIFHTSLFDIQGYRRLTPTSRHLVIYLEGDGAAWKNRHTLAMDPTPKNPTALRMAAQDLRPNVLYLARPCQYQTNSSCTPEQWSSHRYSLEIVQAISQAIDAAKQTQISDITLIGYSGGGVLATLLAARRSDVKQVITIAANLDINLWAELHRVTPLWGSANPCDYVEILQYIPQIHIVAEKDTVVPLVITQAYINSLPSQNHIEIITIKDASHHANWGKLWPSILSQIQTSIINSNSL